MKVCIELNDFVAWGHNAIDTWNTIKENNLMDEFEQYLEEIFEDGCCDEVELNYILTHEWQDVYDHIGLDSQREENLDSMEDFSKKKNFSDDDYVYILNFDYSNEDDMTFDSLEELIDSLKNHLEESDELCDSEIEDMINEEYGKLDALSCFGDYYATDIYKAYKILDEKIEKKRQEILEELKVENIQYELDKNNSFTFLEYEIIRDSKLGNRGLMDDFSQNRQRKRGLKCGK